MPDLSVIIPARREEWLERTVRDVLSHAKANTEVIAILDGDWPDPGLPILPQLRVVYHATAIGQRAATNLGARISTAKYVCKLDAHCSVADGFDVALIKSAEELGEDVTQIPTQRNLHIYDVVCKACNWKQYQGLVPPACPKCKSPQVERVIVWKPKGGSTTTSWIFDHEPRFQYDKHRRQRQPNGAYLETMSSLGACFFMTRKRFLALGGLDESHGSWGSFGIEIGCKSWLSGGRQVTNMNTWFAHFFRVGGLKFPYPITGREQEKAREYARDLWFHNKWPGQVRPLSWLVEKFTPIQGWHGPEGEKTLAEIRAAGEQFTAERTEAVA